MPKIKTHKATAKRFKYSGTGKLLRTRGPKGHLRRHKAARVKRMLAEMVVVDDHATRVRVQRLAPYLD
ncbi:MAG: 50S ribosomal protein L35 [Anaerolineae bacterium]|jgi:large subunit ribosomal protein L35